jgi:hypothetical protein
MIRDTIGNMLVLIGLSFALFYAKESFCLNLTTNGNDVEHLKQLVLQLNTSYQHNVIKIGRLKNEIAGLKTTLTGAYKSKFDLLEISYGVRILKLLYTFRRKCEEFYLLSSELYFALFYSCLKIIGLAHFYTSVFRQDVSWYSDICPFVFPSVRSFLLIISFLCHISSWNLFCSLFASISRLW